MDIERIIHSDIPDIAQVYGGVRGRAMTAKYQGREWPMHLERLSALIAELIP